MTDLLAVIEAFLLRHSMAPSSFGQSATGDRHLVRQLRGGRRLWPETERKIRKFMEEHEALDHAPRVPVPTELPQGEAA